MRFDEQEKSSGEWDSNFYRDKLKRGLEQVHAGLGIIKTMEKLEAMEKMKAKVLQISYEPERDRLTWDGWALHCGQSMEVLLPDQLGGGTWRSVSFSTMTMDGTCPGICLVARGWSYPGVSLIGLWERGASKKTTRSTPRRFLLIMYNKLRKKKRARNKT